MDIKKTGCYYQLTNSKGASVVLSEIGAGIVSICVPDRDGNLADVVLGYSKPESYIKDGPCLGKCPGRFANRIALGKFTLDGTEYSLPVNNGPNSLHGGPDGFANRTWESRIVGDAVEFMYFSEDGEQGYPGNLKAVAHYEWSEDNELKLTFTAECDAPTVINLTNHVYFNLDGEGSGSILDHILKLNCSEYLPTDDTQIPLGDSEPVAGTPMDFINPKPIGRDINADFKAEQYDTPLLQYIHDFNCVNPEDCMIEEVGEAIGKVKVNAKERLRTMLYSYQGMTDMVITEDQFNFAKNEGLEEGLEQGLEQGREQGISAMVKNLLDVGTPLEYIRKASGWTDTEILALK